MTLSPEERRKIYEEEKARIEAELLQKSAKTGTSTGLEPNVAGLLCYVGFWITGIIFLVLEQRNRFVRFHAIQSIIVFGALAVASAIFSWLPVIGAFFGIVIGILIFILWIILMIKAYQGELFKIAVAGDLTERIMSSMGTGGTGGGIKPEAPSGGQSPKPPQPPESSQITASLPFAESPARRGVKIEDYGRNRTGRIASSSFTIAWSFVLLIFFVFFSDYIAYYHQETIGGATVWQRTSLITSAYNAWLPILVTTLTLTITGHIILIIYDRYILREITIIILNIFAIATVLTLFSLFPFNFNVIPYPPLTQILPVVVRIALIAVAVAFIIASIVSFIRLVVNVARGKV